MSISIEKLGVNYVLLNCKDGRWTNVQDINWRRSSNINIVFLFFRFFFFHFQLHSFISLFFFFVFVDFLNLYDLSVRWKYGFKIYFSRRNVRVTSELSKLESRSYISFLYEYNANALSRFQFFCKVISSRPLSFFFVIKKFCPYLLSI